MLAELTSGMVLTPVPSWLVVGLEQAWGFYLLKRLADALAHP